MAIILFHHGYFLELEWHQPSMGLRKCTTRQEREDPDEETIRNSKTKNAARSNITFFFFFF